MVCDITPRRTSTAQSVEGVSPYVNNTSNELTSTPNASYTYDFNGNTTTKTVSSATTNYSWDYENRLGSVTLPGTGGSITFKYDPRGRRVQKAFTQNSTTTTTNYLYDGSNAVADIDQNGSVLARYAETQNIDEPLAELRSGTTSYYEADGLGSVTSLSSGAGAIANTYTYDSFGKLTASTGSITNRFQYTAREFDSESGLYYYRARYYDPNIGRFVTEDPMRYRGGSADFYSYVSNSPIRYTDPQGECPQFDSVTRYHMQCEQSALGIQLTKQNKCACHCVYAPNAPPGQGCIDVCMDCYSKSPTPYGACLCLSKQLYGRTKEQAEFDCRSLKPRPWWWPW